MKRFADVALWVALLFVFASGALTGCGTYGVGPRPSVPASDLYKIVKAKQP
jgi:hypothetical protein